MQFGVLHLCKDHFHSSSSCSNTNNCRVVIDGKRGLFPDNFVKLLERKPSAPIPALTPMESPVKNLSAPPLSDECSPRYVSAYHAVSHLDVEYTVWSHLSELLASPKYELSVPSNYPAHVCASGVKQSVLSVVVVVVCH